MTFLKKNDIQLRGMLDYGCGKGFDADFFGMDKYDPHFFPDKPTKKYQRITCNYVLNVIESDQEVNDVISDIQNLLVPGGCAYIAVRNDRENLNGKTKKGAYQRLIQLDALKLFQNSDFTIYIISKGEKAYE